MGILQSTSENIEGIDIHPWPTTPTDLRVVRVDGVTVGVSKNGTAYASCLNKKVYYGFGNWDGAECLLYGLEKLGRVTKAEVDAHVKAVKARTKRRNSLHNAESIARCLHEEGLTLEKSQLDILLRRVREYEFPYEVNKTLERLEKLGIPKRFLKRAKVPA